MQTFDTLSWNSSQQVGNSIPFQSRATSIQTRWLNGIVNCHVRGEAQRKRAHQYFRWLMIEVDKHTDRNNSIKNNNDFFLYQFHF